MSGLRTPFLLSLAFAIVAGVQAWYTPMWEGLDERAHFEFASFLQEEGRLPVHPAGRVASGRVDPGHAPGSDGEHRRLYQSHHPPLFYALAGTVIGDWRPESPISDPPHASLTTVKENLRALLAGLDSVSSRLQAVPGVLFTNHWVKNASIGHHDPRERLELTRSNRPFLWTRLLAVLLSAPLPGLVWCLGRRLVPRVPAFAVGAACVAGFIPQVLHVAGGISNDGPATAIAAGVLVALVAAAKRPSPRAFAFAGGLCGLGLLTKLTVMPLVPVGVVAALWNRGDRSTRIRACAAFLLSVVAVSGWWFARNAYFYGDFLGTPAYLFLGNNAQLIQPFEWADFGSILVQTYVSFWGLLGYFTVPLPAIFYLGYGLLVVAGIAYGVVIPLRGRTRGTWETLDRETWTLLLVTLVFVVLQYVAACFRFSQPQGRFLFPALGPIALFIGAGLFEWARRQGLNPVRTVVAVGLAIALSTQVVFYAACAPLLGTPIAPESETESAAAPGSAEVRDGNVGSLPGSEPKRGVGRNAA